MNAEKCELAEDGGRFSLAEARYLVRDLFEHRPIIYWTDFLLTIFAGYLCFGLSRRWQDVSALFSVELPIQGSFAARSFLFIAACLLYFRAVNFIHEVVHLPDRKFWFFKVIWNLLCGIPFLAPSFTHEGHLDHHRRHIYGTTADGEYLALGRLSRWWIAAYLSQAIWAPPLAVLRFGLLTPASWLHPRIRNWVHQRFSSLVMDPRYVRPLPNPSKVWSIRLYEALCFAWMIGVSLIGLQLGWSRLAQFLLQAYLTGAVVVFLNCLRTMAAHRFRGSGHESTFLEQLRDSVNIDSNRPWDIALAPVGLRFHATHHLFPAIPYHNLPTAHNRLMAGLPADSPYRETSEPSLAEALIKLLRRDKSRPQALETALSLNASS